MESLQEQLSVLRRTYATQLQERILYLEALWSSVQNPATDSETLRELYLLSHRLAGTGATFGFLAVGRAAHSLELQVRALLEAPQTAVETRYVQIEQSLRTLRAVILELVESLGDEHNPEAAAAQPSHQEDELRLIYLVEDDDLLAQWLALQIEPFGYVVRVFTTPGGLLQQIAEAPPAAVIMDVMFPGSDLAGTMAISEIRQFHKQHLPIIVISSRDDLIARLEAVRAGCDAYLTKPIDISALIDKLDDLTSTQSAEPFRILIVDDDPGLTDEYARALTDAGMLTDVVNDPLHILERLSEFRPDLILMDLVMSGYNGLELARVIRQQAAYVGIAIVFLSPEIDLDKHLALRIGGDDFLPESIEPEQLIAAVLSRAQRSIQLRSLMTTDSLTGLLNHTTFRERLELEVARARRLAVPLSLAVLDIDHFKLVNDTYGHPTGDRVLRSLSRLLQQRLRQTDAIGRYGGEEFGIILPNTDGELALKLMQELRVSFGQVQHQAENSAFSVTFSCGIASLPQYSDPIVLNDAADKALYEAKRSGRNRVVLTSAGPRAPRTGPKS